MGKPSNAGGDDDAPQPFPSISERAVKYFQARMGKPGVALSKVHQPVVCVVCGKDITLEERTYKLAPDGDEYAVCPTCEFKE